MGKISIPVGTTEEQWIEAAKNVIAKYDGDAVTVVAQMMVAHTILDSQLAHLHSQIEQLAADMPGLINIQYQDLTGRPIDVTPRN